MPFRSIPFLVVTATLVTSVVNVTATVADDISNYGTVRISDSASYYGSSDGQIIYEGGGYYGAYPSPASQFAPPQDYRVNRTFFNYQRYYPTHWYGQAGSRRPAYAPMVYHPTDTTQLGFYYQHVPVWQPNPRMIPEPHPATWHNWGRLPGEMVWHRTGEGQPQGIVDQSGRLIQQPESGYYSEGIPVEQYQPEESIKQKEPLPLQPKKLVPPNPKTALALPPLPQAIR